MLDFKIDGYLKQSYGCVGLGCLSCEVAVAPSPQALAAEIAKACEALRACCPLGEVQNRERIAQTRACYRALGKDAHRYRCSAEALCRRVAQGKGLYQVNNVVDSNNLVSIKTGFSLGVYDAEALTGPVIWMVSPPGAHYQGIGKEQVNIERLPVLTDAVGMFGNPMSDSVRAMVTGKTRRAVLCVYGFDGENGLLEALSEARRLLELYCDGRSFEQAVIL